MNNSPFKYIHTQEVLSDSMTEKNPIELAISCLAASVMFGVDRVEKAIHATYPNQSAFKIIQIMNKAAELKTKG